MAIAFFDLDKTICSVPTEEQMTLHMWKKRRITFKSLILIFGGFIQYNLHLISDYTQFRKKIVNVIMSQFTVHEFDNEFEQLFHNNLKHRIFPEVRTKIEEHKKNNHKVVIISTAIDSIVAVFARELGVDYHYSTKLEKNGGRYTGRVLGSVYHGFKKQEAVLDYCKKENVDPKTCFAYGDYFEDRMMLDAVGTATAIDPDRKLLKVARKKQWAVIDAVVFN